MSCIPLTEARYVFYVFLIFVFGPYLAVFRGYFCLCIQELLLTVLGELSGVLGIKCRLAAFKASALAVLSMGPVCLILDYSQWCLGIIHRGSWGNPLLCQGSSWGWPCVRQVSCRLCSLYCRVFGVAGLAQGTLEGPGISVFSHSSAGWPPSAAACDDWL